MLENVNLEEKKAYYYKLLSRKSTLLNYIEMYGELTPKQEIESACLDIQIEFLRGIIPSEEL